MPQRRELKRRDSERTDFAFGVLRTASQSARLRTVGARSTIIKQRVKKLTYSENSVRTNFSSAELSIEDTEAVVLTFDIFFFAEVSNSAMGFTRVRWVKMLLNLRISSIFTVCSLVSSMRGRSEALNVRDEVCISFVFPRNI
eukprot:TRINITY_DN559_c0_g1_i7.p1 TRINITY_DN559_c0_g1~~TRINITY_DN559_c0_g1_i7.p1  ORF type:complete len:142 (+),score=1.12 TRINITY_DN559_c0_g1_i7:520-945(+)